MVDKNFFPKLSQNLLEILNDEEYYDITIEVGNDPYVKIFRAHMIILNYRSSYLQRILSTNKKKNDGTLEHIKLPNILPETFQIILRYIYGGKLSLEKYDISDIIKLLVAANELSLQELTNYLQTFLIENKPNLTGQIFQNFNLIYQTIYESDSFLELKRYCTDLISKEPDRIFKSLNFSSIPEKLLVSLIQSDNLQMREVQVWEYVIKWGLAQNPELPSDPTNFSKEDFNALKNTLQQCIPLIRFYNLTSREFTNKILPYKKIIPKELYKDLLKTFLDLSDPDSKPGDKSKPRITKEANSETVDSPRITKEINLRTVDSKIITHQHVELISKWIDKLEITDGIKNYYEFKLLFRGSRDGLTSERFHKICGGQSRTVTIVKVEGSREILGGYNPIEWKCFNNIYESFRMYMNYVFGITKDSFIFSFKNDDSIENCILSRVVKKNYAIQNFVRYGPSFGDGDLTIWSMGSGCLSRKVSYEKPIRETRGKFFVEECEVFQIL